MRLLTRCWTHSLCFYLLNEEKWNVLQLLPSNWRFSLKYFLYFLSTEARFARRKVSRGNQYRWNVTNISNSLHSFDRLSYQDFPFQNLYFSFRFKNRIFGFFNKSRYLWVRTSNSRKWVRLWEEPTSIEVINQTERKVLMISCRIPKIKVSWI